MNLNKEQQIIAKEEDEIIGSIMNLVHCSEARAIAIYNMVRLK